MIASAPELLVMDCAFPSIRRCQSNGDRADPGNDWEVEGAEPADVSGSVTKNTAVRATTTMPMRARIVSEDELLGWRINSF